MAALSIQARLLLVGLWTVCDHENRVLDKPRRLWAQTFPHEPVDVAPLLLELASSGFIARECGQITITPGRLLSVGSGDGPPRPGIPAAVKRAVYARDMGRCCFCHDTYSLEYDHIVRYRDGGGETVENLRLLCRPCNQERG